MVTVRIVLGDLPAADLGPTDCHEHLFLVTPLLVGDELEARQRSWVELVANPARLLARFPALRQ